MVLLNHKEFSIKMPRTHIWLEYDRAVDGTTKLNPKYHPLGQPGEHYTIAPRFLLKIPYGLRVPLFLATFGVITWVGRHLLWSQPPRTTSNVRIPITDPNTVQAVWEYRFRTQQDIFRWGHIYAAMQEKRIKQAKEQGLISGSH